MDLCFIDTETTSLSAEDGEIWEFGGIRCAPDGRELRRLEFQIECDLGKADPFSLSIGRYRERFGQKGVWTPEEYEVEADGDLVSTYSYNTDPDGRVVTSKFDAAKLIEEFTRGATLVGNVVSFDSERLERLLRGYNECPGWHYHVIDMEPYAVGFLKGKGLREFTLPYKSKDISAALGVTVPEEGRGLHTAMGDAEWVLRMWDAIQNWSG